jgi:hypothetical protein
MAAVERKINKEGARARASELRNSRVDEISSRQWPRESSQVKHQKSLDTFA